MHREERPVLAPEIRRDLQRTVDLMSRLVGVPVGLLNMVDGDEFEIAVSADNPDNPYGAGLRIPRAKPGVYCEKVLEKGGMLVVEDAAGQTLWPDAEDFRPAMNSYLGFPIRMPDGEVFGTLCVMDREARAFDDDRVAFVEQMRDLAERHLALWWLNSTLGDRNRSLADYGQEIRALRGMLPICCNCKSIREDAGYWRSLDTYFREHAGVEFTHGICPDCSRELYPELHEGTGTA
jgi:GAF domain-containing protein